MIDNHVAMSRRGKACAGSSGRSDLKLLEQGLATLRVGARRMTTSGSRAEMSLKQEPKAQRPSVLKRKQKKEKKKKREASGVSAAHASDMAGQRALGYKCVSCGRPCGKWGQAMTHMRECCPAELEDKNGLQQRCAIKPTTSGSAAAGAKDECEDDDDTSDDAQQPTALPAAAEPAGSRSRARTGYTTRTRRGLRPGEGG